MRDRILQGGWGRRTLLWLSGLGAVLGLVRNTAPAAADNGQSLILGDSNNTATQPTRLVGTVAGNSVLQVEQASPNNPGEAILAIGQPGIQAIFGMGGDSTGSGRGGDGVSGQGGKSPSGESGVGVFGGSLGADRSNNVGDGVRGITRSSARAGVAGYNFGPGAAVRGHSAVPTGGTPSPTGSGTGVEGKSGSGIGVLGDGGSGRGAVFSGGTAPLQLKPSATNGPPKTGAHEVGDIVLDKVGTLFICIADGTPGTWAEVSVKKA